MNKSLIPKKNWNELKEILKGESRLLLKEAERNREERPRNKVEASYEYVFSEHTGFDEPFISCTNHTLMEQNKMALELLKIKGQNPLLGLQITKSLDGVIGPSMSFKVPLSDVLLGQPQNKSDVLRVIDGLEAHVAFAACPAFNFELKFNGNPKQFIISCASHDFEELKARAKMLLRRKNDGVVVKVVTMEVQDGVPQFRYDYRVALEHILDLGRKNNSFQNLQNFKVSKKAEKEGGYWTVMNGLQNYAYFLYEDKRHKTKIN